MKWDKKIVNTLFPSGYLPNDNIPVEELIYGDYDVVSTKEYKMARNMITDIIETTWYPDGTINRVQLYDTYAFPCVGETPLLSVYGGKMVQNWLQLSKYHTGQDLFNEKKENSEDVGFNYTGL